MYKYLISLGVLSASLFATGCAMQPTQPTNSNFALKTPSAGKAGVYVFRNMGDNVGRDVWINGECAAKMGKYAYVYKELDAGKNHVVSVKGMLKNNHTTFFAQAGQVYFFEQAGTSGSSSYAASLFKRQQAYSTGVLAKSTWVSNSECAQQSIRTS